MYAAPPKYEIDSVLNFDLVCVPLESEIENACRIIIDFLL